LTLLLHMLTHCAHVDTTCTACTGYAGAFLLSAPTAMDGSDDVSRGGKGVNARTP